MEELKLLLGLSDAKTYPLSAVTLCISRVG